jgi:hypothetical protein
MLDLARLLFNLFNSLLLLVLCLIIFHFVVLAHFSKQLGRYPWLSDLNTFRKRGDLLAKLGYFNVWLIFALGAMLVFPPLVLALNR